MDPMAEKRFQTLKRKLDALHYSQPLTIESAALVERLLNDLIKTTETFQSMKRQYEELKSSLAKEQQLMVPLKKENERVVRENNEMHIEVIRVKEDVEAKENKWRAAIKALESERSDLRFVINQKDHRVQSLESEVLQLKEKLDAALARNYLPSQNEVLKMRREDRKMLGASEANILGRKQDIQMTHTLMAKREDDVGALEAKLAGPADNDKEVWADELRVADERTKKFREQAEKLDREFEEMKSINASFKRQVEARDGEIKRLQGLYEGGQNIEKIATKHLGETSDQLVQRLNSHIDFLNKENHRLDNELKKCKPEDRAAAASIEAAQLLRSTQAVKKQEQMLSTIRELERSLELADNGRREFEAQLEEAERSAEERVRAEQQKADLLAEQIGVLEKQLSDQELVMESSSHMRAAYTSDKRAYNEVLEKSRSSQVMLERTNNELRLELEDAKSDLEKARNEVNLYKGKMTSTKREIEMVQGGANRATAEAREQSEECVQLRKQLHQMEGELLTLRGDRTNLKFEVDRLVKQKYGMEEQIASFKSETLKKKSEVEGTGAAALRFETLYHSALSEIEFLKKDNQQLDQLFSSQKAKVSEIDQQSRGYYMELISAQENIKTLKQEHKMLSDELGAKIGELRKAETARTQLERRLEEVKGVESQVVAATSESRKHLQEAMRVENERAILDNKVKQLEAEMTGTYSGLNERIEELEGENRKLREQVMQLEAEKFTMLNQASKARTAEQDLMLHKSTLEEFQRKEAGVSRELAELRLKAGRMETEALRFKKKAESHEERVKELEVVSRQRLEENMELRKQLSEKDRKVGVESEYTRSMQQQVEESQKSLLAESRERERLERELRNTLKELDNSRSKEAILNDQINKLKSLVESLDKTKDELLEHLKQVSEGKRMEEGEKAQFLQQVDDLSRELSRKQEEVGNYHSNLVQSHETMDRMQKELDEKTEDNERLKLDLGQCSDQLGQLKSTLTQQSSKEENYSKRVYERESEIRDLRIKLTETGKVLEETKEALFYKSKECEELGNDVQMLTKENQYVNAELVRISQLRDQLKQANEELQGREMGAQQTIRAGELEREDILHTYHSVCDENARLKESLNEIVGENRDMIMKMQEYEQELYARELRLQSADHGERKYIAEIQGLERQVSSLVKELERAQGTIRESEGLKKSVIGDAESAKNLYYRSEANKEELQRVIAELHYEKTELEEYLAEAERQAEHFKSQVDMEKVKYSELELVLSRERNAQHEQHLRIQGLEKEKNDLRGEIGRLKVMIAGYETQLLAMHPISTPVKK